MEEKVKVKDIIVNRLIEKIQKEGKLPWQKPFLTPCINWYSETEYRGVNSFLLEGGEYITVNQLKKYNEKSKTNYWFEKGTPYYFVVFYSKTNKKLSASDVANIQANGVPEKWLGRIHTDEEGNVLLSSWVLRYYRVYNICDIKDKDGNTLPSKLGTQIFETHTDSEEIARRYMESSGVRLQYGNGGAYYTDMGDYVNLPKKEYFKDNEAYYRVLFHELAHSTGIESRLNRPCFKEYHSDRTKHQRSREELIAEVTSLLLATEAGFRNDTELASNSENYVAGWIGWMKDHSTEVLNGMLAAEKAKDFILGKGVSREDDICEVKIGNANNG